jgi:hypothetical protein
MSWRESGHTAELGAVVEASTEGLSDLSGGTLRPVDFELATAWICRLFTGLQSTAWDARQILSRSCQLDWPFAIHRYSGMRPARMRS